jgi:hypothetical protein
MRPPACLTNAHVPRHTHLLVSPLHAAVALVEVHHVAVCVCQYLDLDVSRLLDVLLHKHAAVTKG